MRKQEFNVEVMEHHNVAPFPNQQGYGSPSQETLPLYGGQSNYENDLSSYDEGLSSYKGGQGGSEEGGGGAVRRLVGLSD